MMTYRVGLILLVLCADALLMLADSRKRTLGRPVDDSAPSMRSRTSVSDLGIAVILPRNFIPLLFGCLTSVAERLYAVFVRSTPGGV